MPKNIAAVLDDPDFRELLVLLARLRALDADAHAGAHAELVEAALRAGWRPPATA